MDTGDWTGTLKRNQAIRELLRMIRAVIRDGEVSDLEAELLRFWLDANPDLLGLPPLDRVAPELRRLTHEADTLSPRAREELLRVLEEATGDHRRSDSPERSGEVPSR